MEEENIGQNIGNIINVRAVKKQLKKATNPLDLTRSLKKILPNNATGLIVNLNGAKRISFQFQGQTHEIVV